MPKMYKTVRQHKKQAIPPDMGGLYSPMEVLQVGQEWR